MDLSQKFPAKYSALVVVDVQIDFFPGGKLPVQHSDEIIDPLNRYIRKFKEAGRPIFFTRNWHPLGCEHFETWPAHCVQDTRGAEFHRNLFVPDSGIIITKGNGMVGHAYSAFEGQNEDGVPFDALVKFFGLDTISVGGLTTDNSVQRTVIDGINSNLRVNLLLNCCRAINLNPQDEELAENAMKTAGTSLLLG